MTCPRSPIVAAGGGVEPATFRTEGTDYHHSTNHTPLSNPYRLHSNASNYRNLHLGAPYLHRLSYVYLPLFISKNIEPNLTFVFKNVFLPSKYWFKLIIQVDIITVNNTKM